MVHTLRGNYCFLLCLTKFMLISDIRVRCSAKILKLIGASTSVGDVSVKIHLRMFFRVQYFFTSPSVLNCHLPSYSHDIEPARWLTYIRRVPACIPAEDSGRFRSYSKRFQADEEEES